MEEVGRSGIYVLLEGCDSTSRGRNLGKICVFKGGGGGFDQKLVKV